MEEMKGGGGGCREGQGKRRSMCRGLSEVLLEEVQHRDLVMFSGLGTSDTVSLVGVDLKKQDNS